MTKNNVKSGLSVSTNLKIIQINAQSIANKVARLEVFVDSIRPDCVSLVEHWCSSERIGFMAPVGYRIAAHYCRPKREHGGSSLFVRSSLQILPLNVDSFSIEMHCEVCGIKIRSGELLFIVLSVYRPPSGDYHLFLRTIEYVLNYCATISDVIFLCGDLNVDYLVDDTRKKLLKDLFLSFNLNVESLEPTRVFTDKWGNTSSTKVDYIVNNSLQGNVCVDVRESFISDHRAVILDYCSQSGFDLDNDYARVSRCVSPDNLEYLSLLVGQADFGIIYGHQSIDTKFEHFIYILKTLIDLACPLRRNHYSVCKRPTWINLDVLEARERLKNLHWLTKNLRTSDSREVYKTAKSEYSQLIRRTKSNFNKNIILTSENLNKTVWHMVGHELGKDSGKFKSLSIIQNGERVSCPKLLAEAFGKYFTEVNKQSILDFYGNDISKNCTTQKLLNCSFYFFPVTADEVLSIIRSLKNSKSPGLDYISARILKSVAHSISEHVAHLINSSVSAGIFPSILKQAKVIPVHKKNAEDNIANYRPISILSQLSKVFERIMHHRMSEFLTRFTVLSEKQHGFRVGRSTQTACTEFVEFVYGSLDGGAHVAGIFFDLSRAFDCLQHKFIADKLYQIGFRGIILDWILSYLSNRSIYVHVGEHVSTEYENNLGVPQGSILGPLIFILFMNDLPEYLVEYLVECILILFADDTSFAIKANSLIELISKCEMVIHLFNKWCRTNSLIMNVDKTQVIRFRLRDSSSVSPLVLSTQGGALRSLECIRFLGLYVDEFLRWNFHIEHLAKKLNRSFYAIHRLKHSLPMDALINIYYGMVNCHLCYNIVLWGGSSGSDRVFIAQKKIIRLIFNLRPQESCRPTFKNFGILTFPSLYILNCLLHVKCNINNLMKCSDFHEYQTRHSSIVCIPRHNTSKYETSPTFAGIKFYNHLPNELKSLDIKTFKKKIRCILADKCFYSTQEFLSDSLI